MIICQESRLGFIHIPKAAGSSIRRCLIENLPHVHSQPQNAFHKFGQEIRDWVLGPEGFEKLRWFAVTRHPVHSLLSSYRRTLQIAREGDINRWRKPYRDYLQFALACKDFEEYARSKWIGDDERNIVQGGFWWTYCCDWRADGEPLHVRTLRYDHLAKDWLKLLRDWELPDMKLGHINSCGMSFDRAQVPDSLYADIMEFCHVDVERFGYE